MKDTNKMTINEAFQAMIEGKEVTHNYLRHIDTKSIRMIGKSIIDNEGYELNSFGLLITLMNPKFNNGWEVVEDNTNKE